LFKAKERIHKMEMTNSLSQLYSGGTLSLPLEQFVILIGISFFCLINGRHKMGFLLSYFFIYYWGIIMNRSYWLGLFEGSWAGMVFMIAVGLSFAMAGLLGVFQKER